MTETKEIDGAEGQRAVRAVPPSRFSRLIRNELAWALVIFVLVTVWTWFRVSYADQDVVWAEDGNIFLKEQIEFGTWGTLFMPYAGYQHFLPRVFAAGIVELIPLEHYNRAVFAACAIFAGLVGAATFRLSRDVLRWMPARVLVSFVPVAVPLLSLEIIGNLADLHTYCLWLAAWIVVSKPRTRTEGILWGVAALIACLTEVQAMLVLPVILIRLLWDRSTQVIAIAVGTAIGVAGQLYTWVSFPRPKYSDAVISIPDVIVGWLVNAELPIWNGYRQTNEVLLYEHGLGILVLALLPFALAALIALLIGGGHQRFALVTMLFVSAGTFGGSLILNPHELFQYARFEGGDWFLVPIDIRYGAAAALFVLATMPFAASALVTRFSPKFPLISRVVVVALTIPVFVYIAMQGPEIASAKGAAQPWGPQVDAAVVACQVDPGADFTFETAPGIRTFELSCDEVLERSDVRP